MWRQLVFEAKPHHAHLVGVDHVANEVVPALDVLECGPIGWIVGDRDGAFEEQRGSDWAPRWWRGEDSGLIMPIMIANGRRIDQRSTMAQVGGVDWLREHLALNGFDPIDIDGRDPAAFAWAIISMGRALRDAHQAIVNGDAEYPVRLPYAIAETVKGFGFPGAGTNAAHNLPLVDNPATDAAARERFNQGIAALHVSEAELRAAVAADRARPALRPRPGRGRRYRRLHRGTGGG